MADAQDVGSRDFSLWQLITYVATCGAVLIGATWVVAKLTEANELEAYRRAEDWKAAEAIEKLSELSNKLNLSVPERKELESLRITARKLHDVEKNLFAKNMEVAKLQGLLQSNVIKSGVYEVNQGNSLFLHEDRLLLAVVDAQKYVNLCNIRLGNEEKNLSLGETYEGEILGLQRYRLSLIKVSDDACSFKFSLNEMAPFSL